MAGAPTLEQTAFPGAPVTPEASPRDFGAQIGAAQEFVGGQLGQVSDIEAKHVLALQGLKNEATAQDADVAFQADLGSLETQFYGLKGKAMADAYPKFTEDVAALRQQYLGNAPNPAVQNMLGGVLSQSIGYTLRSAGRAAGSATKDWMIQSAAGRADMLTFQAQSHYNDPGYVATAKQGIKASIQNYGELQGWSQDTIDLKVLEQYAKVDSGIQGAAMATLNGLPKGDVAAALAGNGQRDTGEVGGANYRNTLVQIEFGAGRDTPGNPHHGPVQADAAWWARFGRGGDINNLEDAHKALDLETSVNMPQLKAALGRPVTNGDLYLAHQQGLQGAIALLTHPDAPAASSVDPANIAANIPVVNGQPVADAKTITGQQFADIYNQHFGATAGVGGNRDAEQAVAVLDPQNRMKLLGQTLQAIRVENNAAYADAEHQRLATVRAQKLAVDTAETSAQQQMLAQHDNPTLPRVSILQLSRTPLLADQHQVINRLVAFQASLDRANKPAAGQSAVLAQDAFRRMNLPPDDPNAITTKQQLADIFAPPDHTPGQLSREDFDWTGKQFDKIHSPDGKAIGKVASDFFKSIEPQINRKLEGTGGSPFGGVRMFDYTQAVLQKVGQYQAAGKDPHSLFDRSSPDYVGAPGYIRQFQRSDTQIMEEQTSGAETQAEPVAPAATPAPDTSGVVPGAAAAEPAKPRDYGTLADLTANYAKDGLTAAQARAIAIAKGWAE